MMASMHSGGAPATLLGAIADPSLLPSLRPAQWEPLLACARRNAVLAYLAAAAESAGVIDRLPEAPAQHLLAARTSAARLAQLARSELDRVRRVLQPAGISMLALKGVAYLLRGMPHATTRLLSDIDVMVPRDRLDAAEQALLAAGWQTTTLDPYDQRYYRTWSHELPPLLFPGRALAVDVHHTICPPFSRLRPDPQSFWNDSVASDDSGVRVLSPVDSVLHAATHQFFDSDFDGRFRDLLDLHVMVQAFGDDSATWDRLVARAHEHGLQRPLYYALGTLQRVFGTPVPDAVRREVATFGPPLLLARWMNRTMARLLAPIDPEVWPPAYRGRRWMLFVRSHWLRMPAHQLLPHLIRKGLRA